MFVYNRNCLKYLSELGNCCLIQRSIAVTRTACNHILTTKYNYIFQLSEYWSNRPNAIIYEKELNTYDGSMNIAPCCNDIENNLKHSKVTCILIIISKITRILITLSILVDHNNNHVCNIDTI